MVCGQQLHPGDVKLWQVEEVGVVGQGEQEVGGASLASWGGAPMAAPTGPAMGRGEAVTRRWRTRRARCTMAARSARP